MAKVTIFNPEGVAVEVEAVDAREYIEHAGFTREPKPAQADDGDTDPALDADTKDTKKTKAKAESGDA